jgi:hypothetical protein
LIVSGKKPAERSAVWACTTVGGEDNGGGFLEDGKALLDRNREGDIREKVTGPNRETGDVVVPRNRGRQGWVGEAEPA